MELQSQKDVGTEISITLPLGGPTDVE
jgi:hypothetical protein